MLKKEPVESPYVSLTDQLLWQMINASPMPNELKARPDTINYRFLISKSFPLSNSPFPIMFYFLISDVKISWTLLCSCENVIHQLSARLYMLN